MLRNSIKIALGIAGVALTSAAMSATLPATATNSFLVSGSTALNNQFYANILAGPNATFPATVSQFCTPGTITVYSNVAPGKGGLPKAHQVAIVCSSNAAFATGTGVAANTTIAIAKESNGGSNEGTFNIAQGSALPIWNTTVAPTGCVASTDTGIGAGGAVPGGFYYAHQQPFTEFNSCTGPFTSQVPEVGLADEDPAVFNTGLKIVSPALQANLNTQPMFQNGFGIAVSLQLYRALQRAQGLTLDDTLAHMPNLSKALIRGLYTGFTSSWTQVTSGAGVAINSTTLTGGVTISAQPFLCRRGDNSGTNTSVDIYFLGNRCMSGNIAMKQANSTTCTGLVAPETAEDNGCTWAAANLTDTVFAGTSGGDVQTCLNAHDQNNQFAIGALGTTAKFDDVNGLGGAADGGSNQWRYVRINGALPTVLAQSNGTNDYAMDNVLNMNVNAVSPALDFGNYVVSTLTTAIPLGDTLVLQPGGDASFVTGGLLDANNPNGLAPNSTPVTVAQVTANPVSTLTRSPSGAVNNCQAALPNASKLEFQQF